MADSPPGNQADSIHSQDSGSKSGDKKKSRRPANTAFRQQRLKAWQPMLTPKTVLPLFFVIGLIFTPIGGLLIYASSLVQEMRIDYTDCNSDAPESVTDLEAMSSDLITTQFKDSSNGTSVSWGRETTTFDFDGVDVEGTRCRLEFSIPEDMGPGVKFYYQLSNFYQNHRSYVSSFDYEQLQGSRTNASECSPLAFDDDVGLPIYPCGLIANSLFNDTFSQPVLLNPSDGSDNETFTMSEEGISWDSDEELYGETEWENDEVYPPPNWRLRYPNGYTDEQPIPNLQTDEHFQVWMRTAGLPTFSKLYMRNDDDTMARGTYQLDIRDRKYSGP